jgi:hypothetical protein
MILSTEEYNHYTDLHFKLLYFTGKRCNILKTATSLKEFKKLPLRKKYECRQLFNKQTEILEEFVKNYSLKLSDEQFKMLEGFRRRISDRYFIILKCLTKYAIFIDNDNDKVYGVLALSNPFIDFFDDFPVLIKTTILPFNGKIIYDGFLETQVYLMKSIKKQKKIGKL